MPSTLAPTFSTLTLSRADLAAKASAIRDRKVAKTNAPRKIGRTARFLAEVAAHLSSQEDDTLLPLTGAVNAWIAQRKDDGEAFDGLTPDASILAGVHTMAKAGRLPHGLVKTTGEDGLAYLTIA